MTKNNMVVANINVNYYPFSGFFAQVTLDERKVLQYKYKIDCISFYQIDEDGNFATITSFSTAQYGHTSYHFVLWAKMADKVNVHRFPSAAKSSENYFFCDSTLYIKGEAVNLEGPYYEKTKTKIPLNKQSFNDNFIDINLIIKWDTGKIGRVILTDYICYLSIQNRLKNKIEGEEPTLYGTKEEILAVSRLYTDMLTALEQCRDDWNDDTIEIKDLLDKYGANAWLD